MNQLVRFLIVIFVVLKATHSIVAETLSIDQSSYNLQSPQTTQHEKALALEAAQIPQISNKEEEYGSQDHGEPRSIDLSYQVNEDEASFMPNRHAEFAKRAKPLKNIFMGIYKNYKSTYLGNKTSLEYKQAIKDRLSAASKPQMEEEINDTLEEEQEDDEQEATVADLQEELMEESDLHIQAEDVEKASIKLRSKRKQKTDKPKSKDSKHKSNKSKTQIYNYNMGPGLNMSLDMTNEVVKVKLNANDLVEILRGRWLSDNTEEGRGKKYEMISRVLPLFIIPFLIQSSIVPFLVTKLKLLLIKSILIGKLAIFLLVISAIKNNSKPMQTYEVAGPSYWAGEPSRRSELTSGANAAYNGYRVEGKPTSWIN